MGFEIFFYLVCGENELYSPQTLEFIWYDSWISNFLFIAEDMMIFVQKCILYLHTVW